jgi:hypothetical protein
MTSHAFVNTRIRIPEARRLAGLGSIRADLLGVIDYCNHLPTHNPVEAPHFLVWEGLSSAAVVRYARCFGLGARDPLPSDILTSAPEDLRKAHEYFLAIRNKHVAHSVNDFEENEVVAQVSTRFVSAAEIESIHTSHGRVIGLAFGEPDLLKKLTEWVLSRVEALIQQEATALLPIVRAMSIETIRSFGIVELGTGGNRERASVRRKNP